MTTAETIWEMYTRLDIIPNEQQRRQWQLDFLEAQLTQHPECRDEIIEMICYHEDRDLQCIW